MAEPCAATAAECHCIKTDCDGIHECECGGSWSGVPATGSFRVYAFPARVVPPRGKERPWR